MDETDRHDRELSAGAQDQQIWHVLGDPLRQPPQDARITVNGWLTPLPAGTDPRYGLLQAEAACCLGCRPHPDSSIEIVSSHPLPRNRMVRLTGRFGAAAADSGWRWQISEAQLLSQAPPWTSWRPSRRQMLASLPLICTPVALAAQPALAAAPLLDLHSHAGRVTVPRQPGDRPFHSVAAPMRQGGVALIALAIVADTPATEITATKRIRPSRDPQPGELAAHGDAAFARLHALVQREKLDIVTDRVGLERVLRDRRPAVLVAAEGADCLEGRLERLDEHFRRYHLRHLQLTHYRVNELGDIQTEPPVHGGLTAFGAQVVQHCNRLGIVVDVAHAPKGMVHQVAEISTHPIVLSHSSLNPAPSPRSRTITPDHARLVAATGGIVGIWPPVPYFPDLTAYAEGLARTADQIGADHVGIGTDQYGLLSAAAFQDYRQTPDLVAALARTGLNTAEIAGILGGNFARILRHVLPATP